MHYPQFRQWLQKQTRAWKHSTREIELSAEHEESNPFRPLSKIINILKYFLVEKYHKWNCWR